MKVTSYPQHAHSACPHDCPSTCALEVELLDANTMGRVTGAQANDYTAGVVVIESICPGNAFIEGLGVNALVSAEPGLLNGGAMYHDTAVWLKAAGKSS
ncbi:MAG: hypothetical protein WBO58_01220 [Gammaproteobacteria bacterium]